MKRTLIIIIIYITTGCMILTPYGPYGRTGGYLQQDMGSDIWSITFRASRHTSAESVQTYWLYRCAELTLEKGYDGFEILSPMNLSMVNYYYKLSMLSGRYKLMSGISDLGFDLGFEKSDLEKDRDRALAILLLILVISSMIQNDQTENLELDNQMQGEIMMLRLPVDHAPPVVFDARILKAVLKPIVMNVEICGGIVCEHDHDYLSDNRKQSR